MPGHPKCCQKNCCITPDFFYGYTGFPGTDCIVRAEDISQNCTSARIVEWFWELSDTITFDDILQTGQNNVFVFTVPGNEQRFIRLTVTDENDCEATVEKAAGCNGICPCFGEIPPVIQAVFPTTEQCTFENPIFGGKINTKCRVAGATVLLDYIGYLPVGGLIDYAHAWKGTGPGITFEGKCNTASSIPANANRCVIVPDGEYYVYLCGIQPFANIKGFARAEGPLAVWVSIESDTDPPTVACTELALSIEDNNNVYPPVTVSIPP